MIVITDIPALTIHRRFGKALVSTDATSLKEASGDPSQDLDLAAFMRECGTLHLLVGKDTKKRHAKGVVCHTAPQELPPGCLLKLRDGVLVASIGLALVSASRHLDDLTLLRLCYELCADYEIIELPEEGLPSEGGDICHDTYGYRQRTRLIGIADLRASVETVAFLRGAKRVLDLLDYVAEGSASPRETDVAMYVWCPHRLGGYAFPMVGMNQECATEDGPRRNDLLVDKHAGVEYDSDAEHAGARKNSADSARKKLLELAGRKVVSLTNDEVKSPKLFFNSMRLLGRYTGRTVRPPSKRTKEARDRLHAFVNSPHTPLF